MSRVRNLLMTSAVNSPTVPHPALPFRITKSTSVTPNPGLSFYPFGLTELQSREWWWRFVTLKCTLTYDGGPGLQPGPRIVGLGRQPVFPSVIGAEWQLNLPGVDRPDTPASPLFGAFDYVGTVSFPGWNGDPAAVLIFDATASIFGLGPVGVGRDTRAYWRTDTNAVLPSFKFDCEISITTPGTETGASVVSYDDGGSGRTDSGAVMGFTKDFLTESTDGSICSVLIEPIFWWPYDSATAQTPGPVWDFVTGDELMQVFQQPM